MSQEAKSQLEMNKAAREALEAQIAALTAENQELLKEKRKEFSLKVSEKGGVSVYGLGRFPVTLYKDQWLDVIFANTEEIKAFIASTEKEQIYNQKHYVAPPKATK